MYFVLLIIEYFKCNAFFHQVPCRLPQTCPVDPSALSKYYHFLSVLVASKGKSCPREQRLDSWCPAPGLAQEMDSSVFAAGVLIQIPIPKVKPHAFLDSKDTYQGLLGTLLRPGVPVSSVHAFSTQSGSATLYPALS